MTDEMIIGGCPHWSEDGIRCGVCGEPVPENKRRNNMLFGSEETLKIQKENESEGKSLIIWLNDGKTMKFEKVENFKSTDIELIFDYFGVSTQVPRKAVFNQMNIAGFALED